MPVKTLAFVPRLKFPVCFLFMLTLLQGASFPAHGQQPAVDPDRARALKLYESSNYVEAVPLLEKIAAANPNDVFILSRLGFALYATATAIKDKVARKVTLERARQILIKSNELGDDSNLTRVTLDALASADPTDTPFSNLREAEKAIREGEEAFVRGELDKALAAYERALKIDPKLYEAALYAGDMYFKKGHAATDEREKYELMDKAGAWFARAVEINPNRETAYRYWGDALMMGRNKREESRQKFVGAIVAEPYNRRAWVGLTQWAGQYRVTLGHPRIDVPTNVSALKDNKMTITIDPRSLNGKGDGSSAWMFYGFTRATWATEKFAKEFPNEKSYRHSLREEAEALSNVAGLVKQQLKEGKITQLDPMLERLVMLHDKGLIEAYVLFARANQGIAMDYPAYRKANRDKLRRYLLEYVSAGG
jgi:tetratricopeptide (TPR) repeat protein